jgi:argininosuccinate lyase
MASTPTVNTGFVDLSRPNGASTGQVMVIAAEDCPEAAARRADDLADRLARDGIPVTRTHNVSFSAVDSAEAMQRLNRVMNGELPIVIVNGRGKANPALDEVRAEVQTARR